MWWQCSHPPACEAPTLACRPIQAKVSKGKGRGLQADLCREKGGYRLGRNPWFFRPADLYRDASTSRVRLVCPTFATGGLEGFRIRPEPLGDSCTSASG